MIKTDKVYLIILFQTFHQTALNGCPNASQSRGDSDRDLGGM